MRAAALLLLFVLGCAEQQVMLTPLPRPPAGSAPRAGAPSEAEQYRLPEPGAAPRLELPTPQRFELSNGARVLLVERHTLPIVALGVVWPVGALEDPTDRPGMGVLCADMLDEGAGRRGPLELAEALARLGTRLDINTSFDATLIEAQLLSRNLEPTIELLADVLSRPQISEKELRRVKADTLTRLKQRYDAPQNIAQDLFEAVLYGAGHRRRAPAAGVAEAVALLDHHDCRWWHRERLLPDDASIIIVGDVEPQALRGLLEAKLGSWRAPQRRKATPPLGKVPQAQRRLVAVEVAGKSQTVLQVGEPSVPHNHRDYFPLLVASTILGGQFNSRLMMNLRERRGWAYGATSEFTFGRDGGPFVMRASVKGDHVKEALAEMLREAQALRATEVSEDELRAAKDYLARSLVRRFATAQQIVTELAALEIFSLPEDHYSTFAERIEGVTAQDVLRVVERHLDPQRMTAVLVGDRQDVGRAAELGIGALDYLPVPGRPAR